MLTHMYIYIYIYILSIPFSSIKLKIHHRQAKAPEPHINLLGQHIYKYMYVFIYLCMYVSTYVFMYVYTLIRILSPFPSRLLFFFPLLLLLYFNPILHDVAAQQHSATPCSTAILCKTLEYSIQLSRVMFDVAGMRYTSNIHHTSNSATHTAILDAGKSSSVRHFSTTLPF